MFCQHFSVFSRVKPLNVRFPLKTHLCLILHSLVITKSPKVMFLKQKHVRICVIYQIIINNMLCCPKHFCWICDLIIASNIKSPLLQGILRKLVVNNCQCQRFDFSDFQCDFVHLRETQSASSAQPILTQFLHHYKL